MTVDASPPIPITVNGRPHEAGSTTLAALLVELGYGEATVATAVNLGFVRAVDRAGTALAPGDRVEIVTPRQGG